MNNPHQKLARRAINHFLRHQQILKPPADLPPDIRQQKAGAFVSLHQINGCLRGCIGTFLPTKKNLAEEIIANAVAAATQDPRFPPVRLEELPDLDISVDALAKPKIIKKHYQLTDPPPPILNPKKYGLIVSVPDGRKGLLLPDIPGVNSAKNQIKICYQKAGISFQEAVNLSIFTVTRHQS